MAIGQKMGSLKDLKQSLKKGGGGGQWIKYIPKNSTMNVRFTEEPEEWVNYGEHWDEGSKKSYPCNEEASCPGCANGERKTSRYLTNALDLDSKFPDKVIPLMLPKDLANRIVVKYEKWGSITDRDIELSRQGEKLDTVYDLEGGVKDPINLGQFTNHDLVKVLEDAFAEVFGGDEADDDDVKDLPPARKSTPGVRSRGRSAAAAAVDDEPEVDDTPEEPEAKAPEPEFTPDDEPEVDDTVEAADDGADEEQEEWTEEDLRALKLGALSAVARNDFGVSTKGLDVDEIIEAIFAGAEEDPEAPPY